MTTTEHVPRISLAGIQRGTLRGQRLAALTAANRFMDGFGQYGFAVITETNVDERIMKNLRDETRWFFDQPQEVKDACARPDLKGKRGYQSFGSERAVGAEVSDLKEFHHVGNPTYGENLWPARPEFRAAMDAYMRAGWEVAETILRLMDIALGEEERDTLRGMAVNGNHVLRIIHYPPVDPKIVDPRAVRAAAHADINLITLLAPGMVPGDPDDNTLHLQTKTGHWLPITVRPGDFVVNAGDMLDRLTAGRITSTKHRVVRPEDPSKPRYAYPIFFHPRSDVLLQALPAYAHLAREEPITAGAFLEQRLAVNYQTSKP